MTSDGGLSALQIAGLTFRLLPALVWTVAFVQGLRFLIIYRPPSMLYRLFPLMAAAIATGFTVGVVFWLGPWNPEGRGVARLLYVVNDLCIIGGLAFFRHLVRYLPVREQPPSRAWLAVNYGLAAAVALLAVFFDDVVPAETFAGRLAVYRFAYVAYELVILVACTREVLRIARRGSWRPGGGIIVLRHADAALLAAAGLAIAGALVIVAGPYANDPRLWLLVDAVMGTTVTVPIAARFLGEVVRTALLILLAVGATAATWWGAGMLAALAPAGAGRFVELAAFSALVLAVMLAHGRIGEMVDGLVFRRSRRHRLELQSFVHGLSPEIGTIECCRRAVQEIVRVEQLRGAAIILCDGRIVQEGAIELGPVREAWPSNEELDELPAHPLGDYGLQTLPLALREALAETSIAAIAPITSPAGRHGHLLLSTGLLRAYFAEEDFDALRVFGNQLALVLDAADLLARAVAVERSLAQAEKLAAIGELAARVAHEIRNPVTAARSLAQLLAREPASPHNAEHAELILTELERVERQVRALLRFARTDEYQIAAVDLGELVRRTVGELQPKLASAGIGCELAVPPGVVTRADREKLRQVLVNLVENAIDALGEVPAPRTVSLAVGRANGCSTLDVADNGPGLDPATLERIFEPFFSLKSQGTGLGLAIVRRTIQAHGGRVEAICSADGGMRFRVELPIDGPGRDGR